MKKHQRKRRTLDSKYRKEQKKKMGNLFQFLVEYEEANNGLTVVPQEYNANPQLANWVMHQWQQYSRKELLKGHINCLNSIHFLWRLLDCLLWMEMHQRLAAYNEQFGTTLVPKLYNEDLALGYWVSKQQRFCKKIDCIQLFKAIDFVWYTWIKKK